MTTNRFFAAALLALSLVTVAGVAQAETTTVNTTPVADQGGVPDGYPNYQETFDQLFTK